MIINLIKDTEPFDASSVWYAITNNESHWSQWWPTVEEAIKDILINYESTDSDYLLNNSIEEILYYNPSFVLLPNINTDLVKSEDDLKQHYPEYLI